MPIYINIKAMNINIVILLFLIMVSTVSKETNVTNNNLILTAKITLAHLNKFPNYYNSDYGLGEFYKFLKGNTCYYNFQC